MKDTVTVAAGIIWDKDKILIARRPAGKPRGGYWEFPGGKQEKGETIEETLIRELHEELGITCKEVVLWQTLTHDYPDLRVLLHFFHIYSFEGTPLPKEGQNLKWATIDEAQTLNFLQADVHIVQQLKHEKPIQ